MRIVFTETFQRDLATVSPELRSRPIEVLLAIPAAFREPHRHAGLGLRKIHRSGIWEARLGLDLRIVLGLRGNEVVLDRIASHDEVRRYLKAL